MKEEACGLDLPNNMNPAPHFKAHYGSTPVPHPCNEPAKKTDGSKVMRAVLAAK